jgi:hypothetical protein
MYSWTAGRFEYLVNEGVVVELLVFALAMQGDSANGGPYTMCEQRSSRGSVDQGASVDVYSARSGAVTTELLRTPTRLSYSKELIEYRERRLGSRSGR